MRGLKVTNGVAWRVAARVLRFLRTRLGVSTVVVLALLAYGAWSRPVYPDSVDGPGAHIQRAYGERFRNATEQQRLSPQWSRDVLFEIAGEERRVVWGWVHRVRVYIDNDEAWPGTIARERESSFPSPPHGGDWIIVGGGRLWCDAWSNKKLRGYGEFYTSVRVAPESWMARLSQFVWPFVRWELR